MHAQVNAAADEGLEPVRSRKIWKVELHAAEAPIFVIS